MADMLVSINSVSFNIFINFTIAVIAICGGFFLPISMYALRQFWLVKDNSIFKKRQSSISVCFIIVGMINFCLMIGFFIPRVIFKDPFGPSITTHIFIQYCSSFIVLIAILLWRVYVNYFNVKYSKTIINNEWKSLINSSITNKNNSNWFISHKNTFGNTKYWAKYVILIYIFIVAIYYGYVLYACNFSPFQDCLNAKTHQNKLQAIWTAFNIIGIAIGLPGVILITIIRYKIPKFEDNFFVCTEIKYSLIIVLTVVPLNAPAIITEFFMNDFWIIQILGSIQISIYTAAIFGVILIHTLWSIKRNHHWLLLFSMHRMKTGRSIQVGSSSPRATVQLAPLDAFQNHVDVVNLSTFRLAQMRDDAGVSRNDNDLTESPVPELGSTSSVSLGSDFDLMLEMDKLLKTEDGFGSFMFHLSHEFSVEILLSIIEFIQYKLYIIEKGDRFINIEVGLYEEKYGILFKQKQLIENGVIPESELMVRNNFEHREFRKKYEAVFLTYLATLKIIEEDLQNKFKLLFECMVLGYHLFCKYVDIKAITEINIRYSTRSQLTDIYGDDCDSENNVYILGFIERRVNERLKLLNDDNMDTLILNEINIFYRLFDESSEEMMKLAKFSFVRFRETSLYKKVKNTT